jgi:hypothetical protein
MRCQRRVIDQILPEKVLLAGIERADSLTIDAHSETSAADVSAKRSCMRRRISVSAILRYR